MKKLLISIILILCSITSFAGDWINIGEDAQKTYYINDNIVDEYDKHVVWLKIEYVTSGARENAMKRFNLRRMPHTEKILVELNGAWTKIAIKRNIFYDAQGNIIENIEDNFAYLEYIVPDSEGELWGNKARLIYENNNREKSSSTEDKIAGTFSAGNTSSDDNTHTHHVVETRIFTVVEQMPMFPGGDGALMSYISQNKHYPTIAAENGIHGRVIVGFVVERDGSINDVNILRGVDPSLDKEALRIVRSMPKWTPGKQNGSAVRVKYQIPVSF